MDLKKAATSGAVLAERARNHPRGIYYFVDNQKYTYHEVDSISNRLANGLAGLGVTKGDKLCVLLSNSMEHVFTFFASAKLGTVLVPINTSLTGDQLTDIINNSDSAMLITETGLLSQIEAIRDRIPNLKKLIVCGETGTEKVGRWQAVPFAGLLDSADKAPGVGVTGADVCCLLFTSGTTGLPKGALLSHAMYLAGADVVVKRYRHQRKDIFYVTLPLYHVMGQLDGILFPLLAGGKVALVPRFSLSRYWSDIDRYKATRSCLTGAQTVLVHQQPPSPSDAQHSLKVILSFPVPGTIAVDFEKRFNVMMRSIYGLTEALMPLTGCYDPAKTKPGSLGKPTDYEVRIADDDDNPLPDNTIGNLIFRPKLNSRRVFDGYYKMPAATTEMTEHCWVHSGDLAYRDADGYFWYAGRKKDVIRFKGENISTPQLEGIISSHAEVKECAVIGVPSAISEEDVKALVVLKSGSALKPEQLLSFCEDHMAWFMVPRYVEFVLELPKSATDKVQKAKLKSNWRTPGTWDREAAGYKLRKRV